MSTKAKRQPKAGELASRGSPRFAKEPRATSPNNFAPAMLRAAPASEREPTVYPAGFKIIRLPAGVARGADIWKIKGGMMGGATGACKGTTACPDVARAFIGARG